MQLKDFLKKRGRGIYFEIYDTTYILHNIIKLLTKLFLKIYFIAIPLIVIPLMYRCIKGYKNKTTPENIKLPEETQFSRLLKFREKVDSLNWPEIIPVVTCSEEYAEQLAKRRPLPPISEIQLPFF